MLAARLKLMSARLSSLVAPFEVEAHLADRLNQRQTRATHVMVAGEAGAGTRLLLERLSTRLAGCVVLLSVTEEPLLGWEAAPFEGLFFPHTRGLPWGASLPDILKERPPGHFLLTMPAALLGPDVGELELLRQVVSLELRRAILGRRTVAHDTRLSLLVEHGQCLSDDTVFIWSRFGRDSNCTLVVAQPDMAEMESDLRLAADILVAFHSSQAAAEAVEAQLKLPRGAVAGLLPGQGWCCDRAASETRWFRLQGEAHRT
jgi:hypothetical protein